MADNNYTLSFKIRALVEGREQLASFSRQLGDFVTDANRAPKVSFAAGLLGGLEKVKDGLDDTKEKFEETSETSRKESEKTSEGFKKTGQEGKESFEKVEGAASRLTGGLGKMLGVLRFVTGGFLGLAGVGILKNLADTAARTQTLGVVLNQVGQNAGLSSKELAEADRQVQKLGITAASSRESLVKLIQSGISLETGARLARAAQDLAVVSGENSSDTLTRLILNISQLDTQGLKFMGLVIDREKVMAEARAKSGKEVKGAAEKQVFANAVLAEAAKLTGTYEASLTTVGKTLTSLPRIVEEFKVTLGDLLLPVYFELVKGATEVLKSLGALAKAFADSGNASEGLRSSLEVGGELSSLATGIRAVTEVITSFIKVLTDNADAIKFVGGVVLDLVKVFIVYKTVTVGIPALITLIATRGLALASAFLKVVNVVRGVGLALSGIGILVAGPVAGGIAAVAAPILIVTAAVGALYAAYRFFKTGVDESTNSLKGQQKVFDEFKAKLEERTRLTQELAEANLKLSEAGELLNAARKTGNVDEIAKAKKAYQEQDKAVNDLKKNIASLTEQERKLLDVLDELEKKGKLDPSIKASYEELRAKADAVRLGIKAAQEAAVEFSDTLKAAGIDYGLFSTGIASTFKTGLAGVKAGTAQLIAQVKPANGEVALSSKLATTEVNALLLKLQELAKQTTTKEGLEAITEQIRELASASKLAGAAVPQRAFDNTAAAAAEAERKARAELLLGGDAGQADKAAERRRSLETAKLQKEVQAAKAEIELQKALADFRRQALESDFSNGLVDLETYYKRKRELLLADQTAEIEINAQTRRELELRLRQAEQKRGDQRSPGEIQTAKNAISAADQAAEAQAIKNRTELEKLLIEESTKQADISRQAIEIERQLKLARDPEDLAVKIELINAKYREQSIAVRGNLDALNALRDTRDRDIEQAKKASEEAQRAFAGQIADEEAARRQIARRSAEQQGLITGKQAREAERVEIQLTIDILEQKILRLEREAELLEKNDETAQARAARLEIEKTKTDIVQAKAEMFDTTDVDNLRNSANQFFSDFLSGSKSFVGALKGALSSFFQNIANDLNKELADMFVQAIKDKEGPVRQIFDGFAKSFEEAFSNIGTFLAELFGISTERTASTVNDAAKSAADLGVTPFFEQADVGPQQKSIFEGFKETFAGAGEYVSDLFSDAGSGFQEAFSSLAGGFESAFAGTGEFISGLFDSSNFGDVFSGLAGAFEDAFAGVGEFISGLFKGGGGGGGGVFASLASGFGSLFLAEGGPVVGPGTSTSDSISARLSHGEYVVKAASVKSWGLSFMDMINGGPGNPRSAKFAEGGLVQPIAGGGAAPAQSIKIINAIDSSSVVQEGLNTPAGQRAIYNYLQANKSQVKLALGV